MKIVTKIRENTYFDSVALMQLSTDLVKLEGVIDAAAMMATEMNLGILEDANLLTKEAENAKPNDLVIVVKAENLSLAENALSQVDLLMSHDNLSSDNFTRKIPKTIREEISTNDNRNLVMISTPGNYAATEAYKALNNNLHVFMFSDNVSIHDEVMLKNLAVNRGLLMMGPDCGTAIINGTPLGFANVIRRGSIGIIAASGTGLQEVSSIIHRNGAGVSQAIGIGSRDLKSDVGGIMMDFALDALAQDTQTEVIVLISKPPSKEVARKILRKSGLINKPVIINFLGGDLRVINKFGTIPAFTLEDAALKAVGILHGDSTDPTFFSIKKDEVNKIIDREVSKFTEKQRWIRGLYSGGTFASEAQLLLKDIAGKVYSNVPLNSNLKISKGESSREHTIIDFGEDEYTIGTPHPMIDTRSRVNAIISEAKNPDVAVILMDVVLGFGSHKNPAGDLAKAIISAQENSSKEDRYISFVASICGTNEDFQNREKQKKLLSNAGVIIMDSNAQASRLAGLIASRQNI
jgi:succinyl-CoA synthetase alpha subunit